MSALRDKEKEIKNRIQKFLEELKPSDKIALIFHDDADGFVSALLFNEFLDKKGCKDIVIFPFRIGEVSLFDNGLKDSNKLIILDLSPIAISEELNQISNKDILYIDHHPKNVEVSERVIEYRLQGYIPASRMVYDILEEYVNNLDWLALAGVISDSGDKYQENVQFIREIAIKNKLRLYEFDKQVVKVIEYFLVYFKDNLRKAYQTIRNIKTIKDIDKIVKYSLPVSNEIERFVDLYEDKKEIISNMHFYYFEPKFEITSLVINKISNEHKENVFIFATPKEDIIKISARSQSREFDVSLILNSCVSGLENSNSGGHKPAAGGAIMKKDLEKFKEGLRNINLEDFRIRN